MSTFPRTPQPRDHRAVIVIDAENQRRIAARQTACRREGHDWTDPRNVATSAARRTAWRAWSAGFETLRDRMRGRR